MKLCRILHHIGTDDCKITHKVFQRRYIPNFSQTDIIKSQNCTKHGTADQVEIEVFAVSEYGIMVRVGFQTEVI